jgi:hypothetical protein
MHIEIMNPAMRRYAARLIVPPVLSAFALAGCGGHPPRREGGPADASATGAAAGPSHLLSAPGRDPQQLLADDPLPAAGDEAPLAGECDPNYDPCVPVDSDVDCEGGSGNGPSYVAGPVRVIGSDPYGLDGNDGDGIGCEN